MGGKPSTFLFDRFNRGRNFDGDVDDNEMKNVEKQINSRLLQSTHHFDQKRHSAYDAPARTRRHVDPDSHHDSSFDSSASIHSSFDIPRSDLPLVTRSLPEQICNFAKESVVLLVITEQAHDLFLKYEDATLIDGYPHTFTQGNSTYLQFPAVVKHNPMGSEIVDGLARISDVRMWMRQKEGVTIAPLLTTSLGILPVEDPDDFEIVPWRDLYARRMEFWAEEGSVNVPINFTQSIPKPWTLESNDRTYRQLLQESDRDHHTSYQIATIFYRNKSKVLQIKRSNAESRLERLENPLDESARLRDRSLLLVQEELNGVRADSFSAFISVNVRDALRGFLVEFRHFQSSLFHVKWVDKLVTRFWKDFPIVSSMLGSICCMPTLANKSLSTEFRRKAMAALDFFIQARRIVSKDDMKEYALAKTFALMGMGLNRVQMQPYVDRRLAMHPTAADRELKSYVKEAQPKRRLLLSALRSLSAGADNFQKWMIHKFQTNQISTTQLEGTVFYFQHNFYFILPPDTELRCTSTNLRYSVLTCVESDEDETLPYMKVTMFPKDGDRSDVMTAIVPSFEWDVVDAPGLSPQPDVSLFGQHVPKPMKYPRNFVISDWLFGSHSTRTDAGVGDAVDHDASEEHDANNTQRTSNADTSIDTTAPTGGTDRYFDYENIVRETNALVDSEVDDDSILPPLVDRPDDDSTYNDRDDISTFSSDFPDTDDDSSMGAFDERTDATATGADQMIWDESTSDIHYDPLDDDFRLCHQLSSTIRNFQRYGSHRKSIAVLGKHIDGLDLTDEKKRTMKDVSGRLFRILSPLRHLLRKGRRFQETITRYMFPQSTREVNLMVPPMCQHRETTREGAAMVMQHILHDCGLIDVDAETGKLSLGEHAAARKVYLYGDALTNDNFAHFPIWLDAKTCDPKHEARALTLQEALTSVQEMPGDLHVAMHMLATIYKWFYGGLLQPVQFVLGWKNIKKDVVTSYQNSRKLCLILLGELWRLAFLNWIVSMCTDDEPIQFTVDKNDFSGTCQYISTDGTILLEHMHALPPSVRVLTLSRAFLKYVDSLRTSDDEVCRFTLAFMDLAEDYDLFTRSIRAGDPYTLERILVSWLPIWFASKKTRYFDLTARTIESLYGMLTKIELEEVRANRLKRLHKGKGCVSGDDICEIINYLVKRLTPSRTLASLVNKTAGLMLFRACRLSDQGIYNGEEDSFKPPNSSVLPSTRHARHQVFELIAGAEVLTPSGRKLRNNFLWDAITSDMVKGRAKSRVAEGSALTKAEKALKDLWGAGRSASDDIAVLGLPDPDDNDNDTENEDDLDEEDEEPSREKDAETLAKLLSKAKKAVIFQNGNAVLEGLAHYGRRLMEEKNVIPMRLRKHEQRKVRMAMHKKAREMRRQREREEEAALEEMMMETEEEVVVPEYELEAAAVASHLGVK